MKRAFLRLVGLAGFLVFAGAFAITFANPQAVKDYAVGFITNEVIKRIDRKIDEYEPPKEGGVVSRAVGAMASRHPEAVEKLKAGLKSRIHAKVGEVVADSNSRDSAWLKELARTAAEAVNIRPALFESVGERAVSFIQAHYALVVTELLRDIRIFTCSNAIVFLWLLIASFLMRDSVRAIFLPAVLLLISTLICSYFYLFKQNWLLTIIYSNYMGVGYVVYLLIVFGLLCDIVFNRAAITLMLIEGALELIVSVFK